MSTVKYWVISASVVILSAAGVTVKAKTQAKISDLSFMSGQWNVSEGASYSEEVWSSIRGDGMIGMCRSQDKGKTVFFELMVIQETAEGPVLKLKHFDKDLVGFEEKRDFIACPLVRASANEAVFDNGRADHWVRITYKLTGKDSLRATVEKKKAGKRQTFAFAYRRFGI